MNGSRHWNALEIVEIPEDIDTILGKAVEFPRQATLFLVWGILVDPKDIRFHKHIQLLFDGFFDLLGMKWLISAADARVSGCPRSA
ncbi:hypothetical protein [Natrinema sp. SYSU A 869]|uniref:hypothetical protein n=1 Tax=Natrinema sp. SYSU A 869 TaxID=2871694 RepID=UPI001CA3FBBB|nr:hypothetical protein [Natrinema sp. SYSU A 869]